MNADPDPLASLLKAKMVDGDLELNLFEQKQVSEPDSDIPGYFFLMRNSKSGSAMGSINLRAGYTDNIRRYRGNIGFTVFESFRGHRYSARSCVLLVPLIKALKLNPIWLTCNADNIPSKKIIESIGAKYIETTMIRQDSPYIQYYPEGARTKLRFSWSFDSSNNEVGP
jgi:predicted acetyltransferase